VVEGGGLENCGRVAEWTIAAVLKTADVQASVGSNPTPSATPMNFILSFQGVVGF
jgi:hypothetical protein